MFWIPVAFVCLVNNSCSFYRGDVSISLDQCRQQNENASMMMQQNPNVKAYETDCLEIKLKNANFV